MLDRTARFDRVINSPAPKLATRVDVLYNKQTIIGGTDGTGLKAESFEVTYDRTAAILARGSLVGIEPTRLPTIDDPGPLSPIGYEIQLWRGLAYADGTSELMSLGIFPIQKTTFDGATLKGTIEFLDRAKLVQDARFETDYVITAGTNIGTAIQALIEDGVPGLTYAFQTTTFTTPAVVFSAGDDRWEAARALAKFIGCEVYFDRYGRCTLRAEPGADPDPVFRVAAAENLTSISLDLDREPAFNRVVVTGENTSLDQVYRGVATDDDPASPTYYFGPFGRKPYNIKSEFVSSDEQAATAAQAILTAKSGIARTVALNCIPNPAIEAGDIGEIVYDGLNVNELYILDKFTLSGEATGLMGQTSIDVTVGNADKKVAPTSMVMAARFVQAVSADTPTDPEDTALTTENFDQGGLDGQAPGAGTNTSADSVTGSGTLTVSDEFVLTGGLGLKIDGTAQHYLTFGDDYTSHGTHYASVYYKHTRNPSANAWLIAARDGTDAATAYQIGVDSTGHVIIRDTDSGAVDDTANFTLTAGSYYRFDITAGQNVLTVAIYTGTNVNSTDTGDATDILTCAITATAFSNDMLGLLSTISGTGSPSGNLKNETFESGSNGATPTTSNTSATVVAGSGSCTISTAQFADGSKSLAISGSTYHSLRFDSASHSNHYVTFKYRHGTTPGGNAYIYELRAGNGTTVAGQIGIDTTGHLRVRDSNTGTGGGLATSTGTLSSGTWYRIDATFAGAGDLTVRYYTGATIDSTSTSDAVQALTVTLTATNFSNDLLGLISNVSSGTLAGYIDSFKSDSSALPLGTIATAIGGYVDRFLSDSGSLPEPLDTGIDPDPPPVDDGWIPTVGAYAMATTGTAGTQGSSSASGMTTYTGITGGIRPHGVHVYITATNWSGIPTSTERQLFRPSGQTPAIPVWTWKINRSLTWAQIANGSADSAIRTAARGLAQYGFLQMLSFYHEPDNDTPFRDGDPGYSASDYRNMWRHAVALMRAEWQTMGVVDPKVKFYVNFAGHSNLCGTNGSNFANMYPGDDVIDSISWNPYWDTTSRTGLGLTMGLLNENWNGTSGWNGFYTWATTPRTDFSGAKPLGLGEWGPSFTNLSDSQGATRLQQMIDGIEDYPQLKWLCYWNSTVSGAIDSQLSGHTQSIAKYKAFVELDYMTQTVT